MDLLPQREAFALVKVLREELEASCGFALLIRPPSAPALPNIGERRR